MDNIILNPYRFLGLYANSPTKDRVANHSRLNAFLRVGKTITFPLDLPGLLPPLERTPETMADADAKLTLPKDQFRYAQFWFIKATSLDDIAFNHLFAGDIENALFIWAKKENASSLQNRLVCALIKEDYATALPLAEKLYSSYSADFIQLILGDTTAAMDENPAYNFLDNLVSKENTKQLFITNNDWKNHRLEQSVKPLLETIQSAIEIAKTSRSKGATARLAAGQKLMTGTRSALLQLKEILPGNDLQYRMIADKLGQEILQCGIDYFNDSEEPDAAHKAMTLQAYAQSIVVGSMAKERCKENVNILNKIIAELPPQEILTECQAIKKEIQRYKQLPELICHAKTLLENTRPHLINIKSKLGSYNEYYIKISTSIAMAALHNIIEEVNNVQKEPTIDVGGRQIPISALMDPKDRMNKIKNTLQSAWQTILMIDALDMDPQIKNDRYNTNRTILKGMCLQVRVSTSNQQRAPIFKDVKNIETLVGKYQQHTQHKSTNYTQPSKNKDNSVQIGWTVISAVLFLIFIIIIFSVISSAF